MVIIVLTEDVRGGSLMELLHTDNLFCVWNHQRGYGQVWTMKNYSGRKGSEGECW